MLPGPLSQATAVAVLLLVYAAQAADLREVTVERDDKRYRLVSETYFDASAQDLYRVLINYDLFTEVSSVFVESKNLEAGPDGSPRYFTRLQGCILLFCKSFVRVGELKLTPEVEIVAIADPEQSDFEYSREHWTLKPDGDGTLLIYDFELEPRFWVPPVIGPFVMKRVLRAGGASAVNRIEALAQGRQLKR
jgi:Polyketide cyclase / dehydrase and lipid transport